MRKMQCSWEKQFPLQLERYIHWSHWCKWLGISCRGYTDFSTGVLKRDDTQTKPPAASMVIVTLRG